MAGAAGAAQSMFADAVRLATDWERWEVAQTLDVLVRFPDLTWAEVHPVVRKAGLEWRDRWSDVSHEIRAPRVGEVELPW